MKTWASIKRQKSNTLSTKKFGPQSWKLKHLTIEKWIQRDNTFWQYISIIDAYVNIHATLHVTVLLCAATQTVSSSFAMATTICLGTLITKSPQWVIIRLGDYPIHTEKSNRLDPITERHTHPCSSTHICTSFVIMMACACVYVCVCV